MKTGLASFAFVSLALGTAFPVSSTLAAPPKPVSAEPVLVYSNRSGAIEVSNADGTAPVVIAGGYRPVWRPGGDGSQTDPWRIYYEPSVCGLISLVTLTKSGSGLSVVKSGPVIDLTQITPHDATDIEHTCAVDVSKDGQRLVFGEAYTEPEFQPSSIWTTDLTGLSAVKVYDAPPGFVASFPTFSPDGTQIAFSVRGEINPYPTSLWVANSDGSGAVKLTDSVAAPLDMEWEPNGTRILFYDGDLFQLFSYDTATPSVPPKKLVAGTRGTWWAEDGLRVAYGNNTGIAILTLQNSASTPLIKGAKSPRYRKVRHLSGQ